MTGRRTVDTQQFLRAVWPSTGPYIIGHPVKWKDKSTGEEKSGLRQTAYPDAANAANAAAALATDRDAPVDVYFALGSIKEVRKKGMRVKTNISKLGAFWLDIDVRSGKPGSYQDFDTAAHALRSFCSRYQFPKPLVVNSGGGFHVYWPMSDDMEPDTWDHYAGLLKRVTHAHGLQVDTSRTADRASVLRVVGTYNWKTGSPRDVSVVVAPGQQYPARQLMSCIAAAAEALGVDSAPVQAGPAVAAALPGTNPAANATPVADNSAAMAGTVTDSPSNAKQVVGKCQQLRDQLERPDRVDEPNWYAMIGCLRHAEKGEQAVHLMSKGHPGYSPEETDTKIQQHKDGGYGPSTCVAFENANPDGCKGCPFYGKITTPLQLGRERPESAAPVMTLTTTTGQTLSLPLPPAPKPYKRAVDGAGKTIITVTVTNADDVDEESMIYDNDLYPTGLFYDERARKFFVTIRRRLPMDGWDDFDLALGSLFDRRTLSTTLGDMGVVPMLDKMEHVVNYMLAYIKELQNHAKSAMVYAKMGWREDNQFVLPDQVLVAGAPTEQVTPSRNTINALRWQEPRGDLEEWKSVARLYEQPGMEALQFGFGVGFAAPLFRFTNFDGMIVNMVGEKGSGKSSAALLANSIWGHKKMGWGDAKHDTIRSFYNKLGVLNTLPATYDEITNLQAEDLSDLCYAVSKGQGRQRLNQDGSAKEDHGSWQTMMICTSNASLHSRLTLAKADSSAEAVRVFEYYVPSHTLPKSVADTGFDKLNYHFGLAGPVFMDYVLKNAKSVHDRVQHWMQVIDQQGNVSSGERFWSAAPACVLTAFEASNAVGLTNVDIGRLLRFVLDAIDKMRTVVNSAVRSGFGILTDYLNSSLYKTLTIGTQPQPGSVPLITQEPRGELRIRFESWHDRLYMDRADFRRYCASQSMDPNRLKEELQTQGVLIEEKKHVLGKNTNFGRGQTMCWVLDMANPAMGGTQSTLKAASAGEVSAKAIATAQSGGQP